MELKYYNTVRWIDIKNSPELSHAIVNISRKVKCNISKPQYFKIGDNYYKVKELG